MKKNEPIEMNELTPELQASARKMAQDELRLESAEVTREMIEARAAEYLYRDTPEALMREAKPVKKKTEGGKKAGGDAPSTATMTSDFAPAVRTQETVLNVPLNDLRRSGLNPRNVLDAAEEEEFSKARAMAAQGRLHDAARKEFSLRIESLIELAKTMERPRGSIIQPLIARSVEGKDGYEIVAGHRRWYAAQIAQLDTAPVIVRVLEDAVIIELMLIENLQREDLNPLEEARGIDALLKLRQDGEPVWTPERLAAKIGRNAKSVTNTQRILRVPVKFHPKIQDGSLSRTICYLIAAIPDVKLREKATAEIVKGDWDGPFTRRSAQLHIRRNYMVELRGAPFDQRSADLVSEKEQDGERCAGGACETCPLNSANRKDEEDAEGGHITMCMNPACFQAKVDAHVKSAMTKATADGDKLVTGKDAKKFLGVEGNVLSGAGVVKLADKPNGELVGGKKAKAWSTMLSGEVKPQVTTIIDEKGVVTRVVDRRQAIECAKQNGFADLFVAGAEKKKGACLSPDDAKMKERRAKELAEQKKESATVAAWMAALVAHVAGKGIAAAAWPVLLELAIGHAGSDGRKWVINRRGLEMVKSKTYGGMTPDADKTLMQHAATLRPAELIALVVELLLAQGMRWQGIRDKEFLALLKVCELPLAAIEQQVKDELAGKGKKAVGAPGGAQALSKEDIKELEALSLQMEGLRVSHGIGVMALLKIAEKAIGRPNKCHIGSADNHWLKEDYLMTIAALEALPEKSPRAPVSKAKLAAEKAEKKKQLAKTGLAEEMKKRWAKAKTKPEKPAKKKAESVQI